MFVGKVGVGVDEQTGYQAARLCALNCLAQIRDAVGSLDRVKQVVAITGYVACAPSFTRLGAITNGASELLLEVFGDAGRHARTSLGVASLANDVTAEIDMMVEVHQG
jgi:enamine deaminase RidA (YjgF/YER057c/UK114 family)